MGFHTNQEEASLVLFCFVLFCFVLFFLYVLSFLGTIGENLLATFEK